MARLMSNRRWTVRVDDAMAHVEVDDTGRTTVDGVDVETTALGAGEFLVRVRGAATRVLVAGPPDAPWVWHDGMAYRPIVADPRDRGPRRRDASGDLSAPMPATVRAIHVDAGDAVTRGQTLVVLEAMKMELPLRAPDDGVVADVACRVGELVQPGVPLVRLK
jgi:3-methylcrotonyl-CoA carboxylase alpha subunit